MRFFKTSILSFSMLFIITSFSQCATSKEAKQKLQEKTSFTLGETYYQSWVAGIQGGGSGINLFIELESNKKNIELDSVYFRGMKTNFKLLKTENYVAYFRTKQNQRDDIIMSNEENAEFGNKIPNKEDFSFELKNNVCVISFIEDKTTKYYKIENLVEKLGEQYPSDPPKH